MQFQIRIIVSSNYRTQQSTSNSYTYLEVKMNLLLHTPMYLHNCRKESKYTKRTPCTCEWTHVHPGRQLLLAMQRKNMRSTVVLVHAFLPSHKLGHTRKSQPKSPKCLLQWHKDSSLCVQSTVWSRPHQSVPQLFRKVTYRTELAFHLSKINLNYSNSFTTLMWNTL